MATKRSRLQYEEREGTNRFNDLSDDVLRHILSFIDNTKSTVQTSILSKRWRYVWKDVRVLHLRDDSLTFVPDFLSSRSHGATLDNVSFSFCPPNVSFSNQVSLFEERLKWFDMVLGHADAAGLRALSISHSSIALVGFDRTARSITRHYESLLHLELLGCRGVPLDMITKCLTKLNSLQLRSCDLKIEFDDPFANLPSLSCLKLFCCSCRNFCVVGLKVTGHQLRSLQFGGDSIVITQLLAPKLESFHLSVYAQRLVMFPSLNLPSLGLARVQLRCSGVVMTDALIHAVMILLRGLRYTKSLDLCFEDMSASDQQDLSFNEVKPIIENEISRFTRLETWKIQYPHEEPRSFSI